MNVITRFKTKESVPMERAEWEALMAEAKRQGLSPAEVRRKLAELSEMEATK